jgi:O-antigen/teichoic acid export membrane protein
MIRLFKVKSGFSKNVLTVMGGGVIAQFFPVAISPILTRIYSPEDFGFLAIYITIITLLISFSTGKYENSFFVVNRLNIVRSIVHASMLISILVSVIILVMILAMDYIGFQEYFHYPIIWLYIIPLSLIFGAWHALLSQLSIRMSLYKKLTTVRIVQSITTGIVSLFIGWYYYQSTGLIVGFLISNIISLILLFKFTGIGFPVISKYKRYILLLIKYKKFPKYMIPSGIINALSSNMPNIILTSTLGLTSAGYYNIVQKVVGNTTVALSTSFSEVFKQQAALDIKNTGTCYPLFKSTLRKLFLIAVIPYTVFGFFVVDIFGFVFGDKWQFAGDYALILLPMFFIRFITIPVSSVLILKGRTELDLYWQMLFFLASVTGFFFSDDTSQLMAYFSLSFSCVYLFSLWINYKLARNYECFI